MENKFVLVRGDRSGVFIGELISRKDREVLLNKCRRIWYWDGANSITQLSLDGVLDSCKDNCKFSGETNNHLVLDAIEILELTAKSKQNLYSVEAWRK